MAAQYRILSGSFLLANGQRKVAGDTIELDDDVAATCPAHIQRIEPEAAAADSSTTDSPADEGGDVR